MKNNSPGKSKTKMPAGKMFLIIIMVFVFIMIGFLAYLKINDNNIADNAPIAQKVEADIHTPPPPVSKSAQYEAEEKQKRADSQAMYTKMSDDTVNKMVSNVNIKTLGTGEKKVVDNKVSLPTKVNVDAPLKTDTKDIKTNTLTSNNKKNLNGLNNIKSRRTINNIASNKVIKNNNDEPDTGFNFVYPEKKTSVIAKKVIREQNSTNAIGNYSTNFSTDGNAGQSLKRPVEGIVLTSGKIDEGEVVSIKLTEDLVIGKNTVPSGSKITGKATLSANRIIVTITNVKTDNGIKSVTLSVLGEDLLDGLKATVKKPKVDASGVSSAGASVVTSQLGGLGGLLSSAVRPVQSGSPETTYYLQGGGKCYIKSY